VRLVQVSIPAGKRQTILSVLDEEDIDYVVSEETSHRDYTAVVSFPLPTLAVEPVLDRLREAGIDEEAYTIVLDAETVVSRRFEKLREEYEADSEELERISREELVATVHEIVPQTPAFIIMTVVSAVVATAGLLLDSPAVVVGSMVIAPLIGPAMATSAGTVMNDRELFRQGAALQILGGVLTIVSAAVFAYALRATNAVPIGYQQVFAIPEIQERIAPDVLSLAVALGAGVAGALSLSTGVSTALVGVMIAAALVPPAAVVGIGIAWQHPVAVVGSAVLVLVNFLSINFTALLVLWYGGYRPERIFHLGKVRSMTLKRVAVLGVSILLLSAFLTGVTYSTYQTTSFESETQTIIEETVSAHPDLRLISVDVGYGDTPVLERPSDIVVTVGYPVGEEPPRIAGDIERRLEDLDGDPLLSLFGERDLDVSVHYVAVDDGP
jgi:uncharacterized hydrophobic protein (TIGR00341 family)